MIPTGFKIGDLILLSEVTRPVVISHRNRFFFVDLVGFGIWDQVLIQDPQCLSRKSHGHSLWFMSPTAKNDFLVVFCFSESTKSFTDISLDNWLVNETFQNYQITIHKKIAPNYWNSIEPLRRFGGTFNFCFDFWESARHAAIQSEISVFVREHGVHAGPKDYFVVVVVVVVVIRGSI
jgi:hypothetical protein